MDISFGEALLIFGSLLAVTAALSGLIRGTVLSASVLSIMLGIVLAELDVVSVDVGDAGIVELIELALILTLVSDGLLVDRELLGRHWGPAARALVFAMPITLVLLALGAKLLFGDLTWAEAFLLGAVLCATDPVVTSAVVTAKRVPSSIRHTLNLESGLNDGLALPFVLFFLVLASPGGDAGREAAELVGEAAFGAVIGIALGLLGGWLHRVVPRGVTARYEGIYAIGFGLAAFGLADVTFGNGLIAAFVLGITLGFSEHEITERFADFSENVSTIFQVLTFFVFGALIVATGFDGPILALVAFIVFALLSSRARSRSRSRLPGRRSRGRTRHSSPGSAPRGSPRCCSRCWSSTPPSTHGTLVFDIASFVILASIIVHGLTDTVGARWIARRMGEGAEG